MIASIGQRGRKDGSRQTGMSSALAAQAARPGIQTPYGIMAAGELSTSARPKEHHHAHAPKAASIEPKMDGHDGRDGPRRDGLGTPCDAPRLTVLRASQQQECIDTSSSCKQICRNRASQPESSAAVLQWWVSRRRRREALCSASSPTAALQPAPFFRRHDTKNAGWSARCVSLTRGGRWLPLLNEYASSPDTQVATTAATVRSSPQACGASKNLLGMAFANDPC